MNILTSLAFAIGQVAQPATQVDSSGLPREVWIILATAVVTSIVNLGGYCIQHFLQTKREEKQYARNQAREEKRYARDQTREEKLYARKQAEELKSKQVQAIVRLQGAQGEAMLLYRTYTEIAIELRIQGKMSSGVVGESLVAYEAASRALGDSHKRIYEALGSIAIVFYMTSELRKKIDYIRPVIEPIAHVPEDIETMEAKQGWRFKQIGRFIGQTESLYESPINDLLNDLRNQINEEDREQPAH